MLSEKKFTCRSALTCRSLRFPPLFLENQDDCEEGKPLQARVFGW